MSTFSTQMSLYELNSRFAFWIIANKFFCVTLAILCVCLTIKGFFAFHACTLSFLRLLEKLRYHKSNKVRTYFSVPRPRIAFRSKANDHIKWARKKLAEQFGQYREVDANVKIYLLPQADDEVHSKKNLPEAWQT